MKKMIFGVIVCTMIITTVFPAVATVDEGNPIHSINCDYLDMNVTTDKQSYQKGELISIIITNVDELPMLGFPYLDIYNVSANDLVFWARPHDMPDLYSLDPGESYTFVWNQKDMHENQVDAGKYIVLFTLIACFGPVARDDAYFMIVDCSQNKPPNTPAIPSGRTNGETGKSYSYSSLTTDPEGDRMYYMFDWGDGNSSGWVGPLKSGEIGNASHSWDVQGSYQIRVKAKDECGAESDWSEPLSVTMPKVHQNLLYVFMEKLNRWFAYIGNTM